MSEVKYLSREKVLGTDQRRALFNSKMFIMAMSFLFVFLVFFALAAILLPFEGDGDIKMVRLFGYVMIVIALIPCFVTILLVVKKIRYDLDITTNLAHSILITAIIIDIKEQYHSGGKNSGGYYLYSIKYEFEHNEVISTKQSNEIFLKKEMEHLSKVGVIDIAYNPTNKYIIYLYDHLD